MSPAVARTVAALHAQREAFERTLHAASGFFHVVPEGYDVAKANWDSARTEWERALASLSALEICEYATVAR